MSKKSNDRFILSILLKAILSSVTAVIGFTYLFSLIIYKLDLDLEIIKAFSILIVCLASFIVSFITVYGVKNNGAVLGALCQLPIILFSLFNLVFYDNTIVLFIIKAVLALIIGFLTGYLVSKRSKRYKIK